MSSLTVPASTFARRTPSIPDNTTKSRPAAFALNVHINTEEDDAAQTPSRSAVAECLHPVASWLMTVFRLQTTTKNPQQPVRHTYPNGAVFVSFPNEPLSQRYPVASVNVTRYLRTRTYSTACFAFFVCLEAAGLGLVWTYRGWNPLWHTSAILLWAASVVANVLYVRVRGGIAWWHLRSADPGFISVGGSEIDVNLLRRMLPDGPPPSDGRTEHTKEVDDNEDDNLVVDFRATTRHSSPPSSSGPRAVPLYWPFCDVCCRVRPLRSKHCHDCGRCVGRFDHHCHWIGVCVGGRNRREFLGLLVSMAVAISLGVVHLVATFSSVPERECAAACHLGFIITIAFGSMLLFALLLGLAVQCSVVASNSSTYELLYSNAGSRRLLHPDTGRESTVARLFDFGGYRNLVLYFSLPRQDPINAGSELWTESTSVFDDSRVLV